MNFLPVLLLACTPLLDAPRVYESAGSPVAAVDVDADGAPDVITDGGRIAVMYGRDGTLGMPETILGDPARAFATDVDGDGRTDIVAAGARDTFLLRNLGQRKFGVPELLATADRGAIAVGDFTGDGSPDVVIPRPGSRNGILLRNDGSGHFTAEETSAIEDSPAVAGDLDGDGRLDLVHARASQRMVIERGDGNGRFTRRVMSFSSPATAALEDLDGNGRADLIAMFESDGDLLVYRDALDFTKSTRFDAGAPHATAAGDFNGDGKLDLAVLSRSGTSAGSVPRVLVFLHDGDGKLVPSHEVLIGTPSTESIATADFNRDGALDLVVPGPGGHLGLVFGRGDGTFDTPSVLQSRRHTALSEAIDLNGDGVDELIGYDSSRFLVNGVLKSDGTYHFEWLPVDGMTYAAGDPNEHGWRTLLVAGRDEVSVVSRSAEGVWTRVRGVPGHFTGIASADLDGDGRREIIVVDTRLRVLDANGNERFSAETVSAWHFRIAVADMNRDGKQDLVVMRRGTESPVPHPPIYSDGFVALYLGRGDATFEPETRLVSDQVISTTRVADFNGDGNPDVFVEAEQAMLLRGDGHGGFARQRTPAGILATADLNGDGIPEALLWESTLFEGTRGGLVRRQRYVLPFDMTTAVFARRAPGARPVLVGAAGQAGELYLVGTGCSDARPRGRVARP
jgi:hypothetical protein